MNSDTSLRSHLRKSILKQSAIGIVAMAVVLIAVTYFLGRYKAASDLQETAAASTKAFRGRILDGEISIIERQLREVLKIHDGERALILDRDKNPIYKGTEFESTPSHCKLIGIPCISVYGATAEILMPIYFDENNKNLFGYLYLSRTIHPDWFFLAMVFLVFATGYFAVFFGVTRVTKSTMELLADGLEKWSKRLSRDPKDVKSLSETPFKELMPLRTAIEGLNQKIEEFESKAAEKAKLLMLRGIAHDLLGPVSQVQLYLATLQKRGEAHPELESLILDTIDSIKNVALVASQVKILKEIPSPNDHVDLVTEVKDQIDELKNSDEIKGKQIELAFESGAFCSIDARLSRGELSRILQNLVQNSVHASSAKARIEVGVRQDSDYAILSVKDNGHGIPKEIQGKVFQPDFTLKPGTGTGLGLAIVKYIAEMRKGHVLLDSALGSGTLIQIKIPVFSKEGVANGL
jgi:signal transduction histidine kinase